VLLVAGDWPGSDARLGVESSEWHGLGAGHGQLSDREVVVSTGGRGEFGRRARSRLRLPDRSLRFRAAGSAADTRSPREPVRLDDYERPAS